MSGPIVWDVDPDIFNIGSFALKYYSLLFGLGLLLGVLVFRRINKDLNNEQIDKLLFYVFIGIVLGARLGHCLFYEPEYYLKHPLEMILPVQFTDAGIQFTGFHGLASHGGILGVAIAIWLFSKRHKKNILTIIDKICVSGLITGAFIRMGNFMNSEIIGKATGGDYGIIFKKVDMIARHPAQLYESFGYLLMFIFLFWFYRKNEGKIKPGLVMGIYFVLIFLVRFIIEFFKINQVSFEDGMALNMGQLLSIPFLVIGIIFIYLKK